MVLSCFASLVIEDFVNQMCFDESCYCSLLRLTWLLDVTLHCCFAGSSHPWELPNCCLIIYYSSKDLEFR